MKIYCPLCEWAPGAHDRWMCAPPCGMLWNTFETGGRCPRCAKQWHHTQCLACARWSRHEDWYHDDVPDETEVEEVEELVGAPA